MTDGYIALIHPEQVAREVERQFRLGCRSFVLRPVAGGGMLDQERLGAARYAAGLQSVVELESPAGVAAAAR
jgi:hypothetical protein